jgi:hypothetical protein
VRGVISSKVDCFSLLYSSLLYSTLLYSTLLFLLYSTLGVYALEAFVIHAIMERDIDRIILALLGTLNSNRTIHRSNINHQNLLYFNTQTTRPVVRCILRYTNTAVQYLIFHITGSREILAELVERSSDHPVIGESAGSSNNMRRQFHND